MHGNAPGKCTTCIEMLPKMYDILRNTPKSFVESLRLRYKLYCKCVFESRSYYHFTVSCSDFFCSTLKVKLIVVPCSGLLLMLGVFFSFESEGYCGIFQSPMPPPLPPLPQSYTDGHNLVEVDYFSVSWKIS